MHGLEQFPIVVLIEFLSIDAYFLEEPACYLAIPSRSLNRLRAAIA